MSCYTFDPEKQVPKGQDILPRILGKHHVGRAKHQAKQEVTVETLTPIEEESCLVRTNAEINAEWHQMDLLALAARAFLAAEGVTLPEMLALADEIEKKREEEKVAFEAFKKTLRMSDESFWTAFYSTRGVTTQHFQRPSCFPWHLPLMPRFGPSPVVERPSFMPWNPLPPRLAGSVKLRLPTAVRDRCAWFGR
ncbi:unnamed protein product [Durusdinium trenchii]|uniref:Uncharacterized protein n=1 Tax=Durusdinium trenchii TaxID=1381693 RepID=A0ABP0HEB6_9DINO